MGNGAPAGMTWYVTTDSGEERVVHGVVGCSIHSGALVLTHGDRGEQIVCGPGSWTHAISEVEDD